KVYSSLFSPVSTCVCLNYDNALVDDSGKHDLAQLLSIQDWNLRYALSSVKGVAEVAPVGGFVKQYQVDLDPNALVAYNIPLSEVVNAIKMSNADVGGKVFEVATTEYYIRGRGYINKIEEIKPSLPEGVRIVPTYDRSDLIKRAISTLREKLIEESIIVALVCVVFLWHVRSSLVAIITLPIAIILSFIPMWWMNVTSNI